MKRLYQLGIITIVQNEKRKNAILRAKDGMLITFGKLVWNMMYRNLCNEVRKEFNLPFVVGLIPHKKRKDVIGIAVFEIIADDLCFYDAHWDKEKKKYYIEIEDADI